jgi:hypothetical protein
LFSREGKRLGDKRNLEQQIHEITGIAIPALPGTPPSQFDVDERLSWAENRQTTRKEDEAYSLLGIFEVHSVVTWMNIPLGFKAIIILQIVYTIFISVLTLP